MKKNKKNKFGFTLIELLAVILILAIIAIIAIPVTAKILEEAKKNAFKVSAQNISDAVANAYALRDDSAEYYYVNRVEYTTTSKKLSYTGERPLTGRISVTNEGIIAEALYNGKYCATKAGDEDEVTVKKSSIEECVTYNIIETDEPWVEIANDYDTTTDFLLGINEEDDINSDTSGRKIKVPIRPGSEYVSSENSKKGPYDKTYYSLSKTTYSDSFSSSTYTYTIELGALPLAIEDIYTVKVTAKSVYETPTDFEQYIIKKKMGEVIWPAGEEFNLTLEDAPRLQQHAARNSNMTADDVLVECDSEKCYATITETVDNLNGVDPYNDTEVYLPVKFTVEFNGTPELCTLTRATDSNPGVLSGTGTNGDPYLVESMEDLVALSNNVNAGNSYSGKYLKLARTLNFNNILSYKDSKTNVFGDINGNGAVEGLKVELTTGAGFIPIGNGTTKFSGVLLGNSNCVINLYINRPTNSYVGLVGYNNGGTITALNLSNINITGSDYTGGLTGYNNNGYVTESNIQGNVTGNNYVALGSGYVNNQSITGTARLSSIIVKGNVKGNNYVAGLAGGSSTSSGSLGYITGINEGGSIVSTGANVGRIQNTSGSCCGYSAIMQSGIALNSVTINGSTVSSLTPNSNNGVGIDNLNELNNINLVELALDTYIGGDNDGNGYYWDYDEDNKVVLKNVATTPLTFSLLGSGTTADPYLVNDYADLRQASLRLGSAYKLTSNIDLNDKNFYMLGSYINPFTGNYNGDSKTISNLTINSPHASYLGFSGYNRGTITTLDLSGINVTGANYSGGLAGYNYNGKISDNSVNGNVIGNNYVGLAAGYINNYYPSSSAPLRLTSNIVEGNVSGSSYVGGLAGFANSESSYAGYISGIYESGTIVATGSNFGRILGGINNNTGIGGNPYVLTSLAKNSIIINGSTISETYPTTINGATFDNLNDLNDINLAELGLDTYIGGDNDGNGYYWDYDESGNIVHKKVSTSPLTFSLSGSGTTADPYLINNYDDLKQASLKLGSVYKLNADINLNGQRFYMLGSYQNKFSGTFNGNTQTISNLTINSPHASYLGFVGYEYGGTITNLNLSGIDLTGANYTGSLAGYNYNGKIADNSVNGNVVGNNYVGLATGYINNYYPSSSFPLRFTSNIVEGNVAGSNYVGGLAGFANSESSYAGYISGAYKSGTIITTGSNIGRMLGGINNNTGIGGNPYVLTSLAMNSITINGSTIAETYPTTINGATFDNLNDLNDINSAELALDTYIGGDNDGNGYYWDYDGSGNIVHKSVSTSPLTFSLLGSGTTADPYLINNYDELKQASLKLGSVYKLNADINLSGQRFYMLGSYQNKFGGKFYGNTKTISNLTINSPHASYIGFVGYENGGTITGLNLNNINITANNYTGGIVGFNYNSKIADNIVNGNIVGNNYVGLATGYINNYYPSSSFPLRLTNIIVGGNVTGSNYVGGLAGFANSESIYAGYISGINTGGSLTLTGSNIGRILGGINNHTGIGGTPYSFSSSAVSSITINGSTVTSASASSTQGLDITSSDLTLNVTYTDRGFNFTDETLDYIWYIDSGIAKFREGNL